MMNIGQLENIITGDKNENATTWKGVVAGVVGGLAGAAAMRAYEHFIADNADSYQTAQFSPTVQATNAFRKLTSKPELSRQAAIDVQRTGSIPFGAAVGGVYGLLTETFPAVQDNTGLSLSTLMYSAVHQAPQKPVSMLTTLVKDPGKPQSKELISLAIFGVTTELVRRGFRHLLGE